MDARQVNCDQARSTEISRSVPSSAIRGWGNRRANFRAALTTLIVGSLLMLAASQLAFAQTESVVYSFANPPDGYGPESSLAADAAGNMYVTTVNGGANNQGAIVMLTPSATESVLYSFLSGTSDGHHPVAGLVPFKGSPSFVGTTISGGTTNNGAVFFVNPGVGEGTFYNFLGGTDGANPYSALAQIGTNYVYGTTYNGGQYGYGTVFSFRISDGLEKILHSFNSAFPTLDGAHPYGALTVHKGLMYGTTQMGGASNLGTVFSITKTGTYTLVYSFKGGATDGQSPNAGVLFDSAGNIYGTTYGGGQSNAGVVYEISAGGVESVLHSFGRNSADGSNPYSSLIKAKGAFYGTTLQGGSANGGTIYKITAAGVETVVHQFAGGADGFNPYGALLLGKDKALYGTTQIGGTSHLGTVFKLIP
jgi:uncharacterized repeat protein (TIGR03803 family)